ncbi:MAG: MBL fold metallo-hydrolase [Acidobacteriota bacterium]
MGEATESGASFHVRFWGVRGSVPTPDAHNLAFGGNTPCVEVLGPADEVIILDAGSGIRALGESLLARPDPPTVVHIFLTHFHWDHVQGLPFFAPIYDPRFHIHFHSMRTPSELQAILSAQMRAPFFPVTFADLSATVEFHALDPFQSGDLTLTSFPLHHPQGAVGFHIASATKSVVYATDHEHGDAAIDANLVEVSRNANALIYDSQYTPTEYATRHNWGHSTWLEATHVARRANVQQLVLFHHAPDRHDDAIRAIVAEAQAEFPATIAAQESLTL